MKATELQIGNWVCYNKANKYTTKVQDIRNFAGEYGIMCDRDERDPLYSDENFFVFNVEICHPIPITKDFLIKNQFVYENELVGCFTSYEKEIDGRFVEIRVGLSNSGDDYVVCHIDNADRCSVANADIRYVHQMQNLLSIVGINWEVKI